MAVEYLAQLQGRSGGNRQGKIVRQFPMVPGVDLAGTVLEIQRSRLPSRRQSGANRLERG